MRRCAAEDAEDAAEADAAWGEPGESIALEQIEAEFGHWPLPGGYRAVTVAVVGPRRRAGPGR